jgi:hypothetical protein
LVGEFDIRASRATPLPVRYNVGMTFTVIERESGVEIDVLVWMPRETIEKWGFSWLDNGEVDPGAAAIMTRIGLRKILDVIHTEDDLPTEVAVRAESLGRERPRFTKECAYQEKRDSGIFCKVAAMEDPHGGQTSESLCEGCRMPDVTLACSDLLSPRTAWYPGETEEGVRDLVQSMCRSGNDPETGANCLPGVKECWVKSIEVL